MNPTVNELIKLHSASIAELKEKTKEYSDTDIGVPFDDLFILRFILSSAKDLKIAEKKLRETLAWRTANLDKLNQTAAPHQAVVHKHLKDGICAWIGTDLLFVVRPGLGNTATLLHELSEDQVVEYLNMNNEVNFRLLDAKTRELGVLCKLIVLIDAYGFSLSRASFKFANTIASSSKHSNTVYPQLLRHTVFLNLPIMLNMMFSTLRRMLPKETVEKQRICSGRPHNGQHASSCPYLRSRIAAGENVEELLPPFLGGHAPVPESLVHESDK